MNINSTTIPIFTPDQRLRVFVSSTIEELSEERNVAIQAINDLKLHPVYFESNARPHSPKKLYRSYLEQSHIFIGVYWESYGWVSPDMEISGIEDEFERSGNKPRLIYIKQPSKNRDDRLDQLIRKIENEGKVSYKKFKDINDLGEQIKDDLMLLLSERFDIGGSIRGNGEKISYIELLSEEIIKKNSIYRKQPIDEIKNLLLDHSNILVKGEPGIGKTFILGQLGKELDAIYISLQNKSPQQVFSYMATHLAIYRNVVSQFYPTESQSRDGFQLELANNTKVLIFDDVDQNYDLFTSLQSLEFYETKVIFAARSEKGLIQEETKIFPVPSFSKDNVTQYLENLQIKLSPGEFQRLLSASNKNPLYLYYFSKYQISPFPNGLGNYQIALWEKLSSTEKEIMNLIAFSTNDLSIENIHALINRETIVSETVMKTNGTIENLAHLVRKVDIKFQVFHYYFEEFIVANANSLGLSDHYHLALANHAIYKSRVIPAAIHLIEANDPRARNYSKDAIEAALLSGSWKTCEQLIEFELKELENISTKDEKVTSDEAKMRFILAQVFLEIGQHENSKKEIIKSEELFSSLGETEWLGKISQWSSLLLIYDGEIEKAIDNFTEDSERYFGVDKFGEAISELHLSYAYIQISNFEDGAVSAKKALDLFSELKDERGVMNATVNLSACVGGLGNKVQQEKYARKIIEISEQTHNPRLKAAGLNHLAIVLRKRDDPDGAQEVLEEVIQIAQLLQSYELEAINIGNLGNVFLDREEYQEAEKAYGESLFISREHGLAFHEGRALELLARLKFIKEEYSVSSDLGLEALNIHKKFMNPLRLASTYDYLGRANEALENYEEAADYYQNSGEYYQKAKEWKDAAYAFRLAIGQWDKLGESEKVAYCLGEGINCSSLASSPHIAQDMLTDVSDISNVENVRGLFQKVFEEYVEDGTNDHFSIFMLNFYLFCAKYPTDENINFYRTLIFRLAEKIESGEQRLLINALSIGIAVSSSMFLPIKDLDAMSKLLAENINLLYFRKTSNDVKVWTIGTKWGNGMIAQILMVYDDYEAMKLSLTLSLVIIANSDYLEEDARSLGLIVDDRFSLSVMSQRDYEDVAGEKIPVADRPINDDLQASVANKIQFSDVETNPFILVLHDGFEDAADWNVNPRNKALVWVMMLFHSSFISSSLHQQKDKLTLLGKKSREFCEKVLLI